MQTSEISGQVQQGPRLPDLEQALTALRPAPEARAEGRDADESRRLAPQLPARKPRRYGAGF